MRVLIADPQATVRRALSVWINGQPGWNVVGESSDAEDLLEKLDRFSPEVIIMDGNLYGCSLKDLVSKIREKSKKVLIILLLSNSKGQYPQDLPDVDYCASKIDPPDRLLDAILRAAR